jgi:hypothetical protein
MRSIPAARINRNNRTPGTASHPSPGTLFPESPSPVRPRRAHMEGHPSRRPTVDPRLPRHWRAVPACKTIGFSARLPLFEVRDMPAPPQTRINRNNRTRNPPIARKPISRPSSEGAHGGASVPAPHGGSSPASSLESRPRLQNHRRSRRPNASACALSSPNHPHPKPE